MQGLADWVDQDHSKDNLNISIDSEESKISSNVNAVDAAFTQIEGYDSEADLHADEEKSATQAISLPSPSQCSAAETPPNKVCDHCIIIMIFMIVP